jgi:PPM family protein phosphatase
MRDRLVEGSKGTVSFRFSSDSDVGLVRRNNEDALIILPEEGLFGVCDGLGGHIGGEVASSLAADVLLETIRGKSKENPSRTFFQAITEANRRIAEAQSRDLSLQGMATTVSAVWLGVGDNQIAIGHLGDSRIYRYRKHLLEQLTEDHSPVFELFKKGLITKEEMQRHPQKSLIDRCLGIFPVVEPQILLLAVEMADLFLIATDGLTDALTDLQISEILRRNTPENMLPRLFEEAYHAGAPDNISAVLIEITRVEKRPA